MFTIRLESYLPLALVCDRACFFLSMISENPIPIATDLVDGVTMCVDYSSVGSVPWHLQYSVWVCTANVIYTSVICWLFIVAITTVVCFSCLLWLFQLSFVTRFMILVEAIRLSILVSFGSDGATRGSLRWSSGSSVGVLHLVPPRVRVQ